MDLERASDDAQGRVAFGELVRRYQDAAFAAAFAILKDHAAAEDAAQAAFLTAWLRRHDLREPLAFGGWLRTIVRTECFRILRRREALTIPLDDLHAAPVAPPADHLATLELRKVVLEAMAALSDSHRTVIALRYLSDLSYMEMSEFLRVPVSTIKKRLHDARKKLLAWSMSVTAGSRARSVLRELRPSHDRRFEKRLMTLTDFLDKIVRGDVAAVTVALDAQPELRDGMGESQSLWRGRASALTVAAACGRADMVRLSSNAARR